MQAGKLKWVLLSNWFLKFFNMKTLFSCCYCSSFVVSKPLRANSLYIFFAKIFIIPSPFIMGKLGASGDTECGSPKFQEFRNLTKSTFSSCYWSSQMVLRGDCLTTTMFSYFSREFNFVLRAKSCCLFRSPSQNNKKVVLCCQIL